MIVAADIPDLVATGRISALAGHGGFASYATIPSNIRAVENALLFAAGLIRFCVLSGPSGWGKTSLVDALAGLMVSLDKSNAPFILGSTELVRRYGAYDPQRPLIIEDAQESIWRQKERALVNQIVERRIRARRPTLMVMTGEPCVSELRHTLPYFRRWSLSRINSPSSPERRVVAHMMAANTGLQLGDPLLTLIASRLNGNGRSLNGAMNRLRLAGEVWKSDHEMLQACGVLHPFFLDNGSFDLGHTILEKARECGDQPEDLAAYVMVRVSGLPEDSVARYLDIRAGEVFRAASRVDRKLPQNTGLQQQLDCTIRAIVREIG
jgi:hypothetical protein